MEEAAFGSAIAGLGGGRPYRGCPPPALVFHASAICPSFFPVPGSVPDRSRPPYLSAHRLALRQVVFANVWFVFSVRNARGVRGPWVVLPSGIAKEARCEPHSEDPDRSRPAGSRLWSPPPPSRPLVFQRAILKTSRLSTGCGCSKNSPNRTCLDWFSSIASLNRTSPCLLRLLLFWLEGGSLIPVIPRIVGQDCSFPRAVDAGTVSVLHVRSPVRPRIEDTRAHSFGGGI